MKTTRIALLQPLQKQKTGLTQMKMQKKKTSIIRKESYKVFAIRLLLRYTMPRVVRAIMMKNLKISEELIDTNTEFLYKGEIAND